ncbi:MAG: hypothetical protein ACI4D8_08555 [Wujia sp.]
MKLFSLKDKKFINIFIIILVLFCFISGLQYDAVLEANNSQALQKGIYISDIDEYMEITDVDEITLSAYHTTLIRQVFSKKSSQGLFGMEAIAYNAAQLLFFVCLLFSYICLFKIRDSHRYIINYIHSTDGKKA